MAGEVRLALILTTMMRGTEAFDKAGRGIKGLGAAISSIMPMLKLMAIHAAFDFMKDSVQTFIEFEQVMAEAGSIIGKTKKEMDGMSDSIREMTERVPQSATELGAGLYDILSAGITDSKESLDALELSAKAASAGLTETATAAKAGISTMNAFGMSSEDLNHIFDVQFLTIRFGILRYEELAGVIGKLAPSAKNAGQSMESMFAVLAGLTKKGMSAAEAATALGRAYDAMIKPNTIRKFMDLGISIVELTSDARTLHAEYQRQEQQVNDLTMAYDSANISLKALGDEMRDVSIEQQRNRLEIMKIRQAASDADRELTDQEIARIGELEDANSGLDVQYAELSLAQAETQRETDNLSESLEAQKIASEGAKKAFDEEVAVSGKFRPLVDIVNDLDENMQGLGETAKAEIIANLFPEIRARKAIMGIMGSQEEMMDVTDQMMTQSGAMSEAFAINTDTAAADFKKFENAVDDLKIEFGEALIPILKEFIPILKEDIIPIIRDLFIPALQALLPAIKFILEALKPLLEFLREHPDVVKMLVAGIIAWTIAQWALNVAMSANPIGLIIALVALLVIAVVMLLDHLGLLDDVMGAIGATFQWFADLGGTIFEGFITSIEWVLDLLKSLLDIANSVLEPLKGISDIAGGTLGGIAEGVGGFLGFQHGGIVTQPTLGVIGEAGPEAVIPLDKLGGMGGGSVQTNDTYNITLEITEEISKEKVAELFDWFAEEARRRKLVGG